MFKILTVVTVEPVIFCSVISFYLGMVAMPQLLLQNICIQKYDAAKCTAMEKGQFKAEYKEVRQHSAMWTSASIGVVTTIVICTLPTLGAISDIIGKRNALFLSPISLILQNLVLIAVVSSGLNFATWLLLLPEVIPALVGTISGLYVFVSAYVSLITSEEERRMRMTLMDAVALFAAFTSSLSSGLVIERFGFMGIFVLNIILQVLALLDIVFLVKPVSEVNKWKADHKKAEMALKSAAVEDEDGVKDVDATEKEALNQLDLNTNEIEMKLLVEKSVVNDAKSTEASAKAGSDDARMKNGHDITDDGDCHANEKGSLTTQKSGERVSWMKQLKKVSNPVANFKAMITALKGLKNRRLCISLMIVQSLTTLSFVGAPSILVYYLKSPPYFLSARSVGFFLAYKSAVLGVLGLVLFNWILQKFFKLKDVALLLIAAVFCVIYHILLGVASSTVMLYCIQALHAICILSVPTIRSFITKMVDPASVGTVIGALCMVETFAALIGGMGTPATYAGLLPLYNGAVFFLLAAVMLVSVVIIAVCAKQFPQTVREVENDQEEVEAKV